MLKETNGAGSFRRKLCRLAVKHIRYKEGPYWDKLRAKGYAQLFQRAGSDLKIRGGTIIKEPQNICMGSRVSIQENGYINGYGGIIIGDDVSVGTGTFIFSSTHSLTGGIIRDNPLEKMPVSLGNNIWIGAGVRILGGVRIGDNVVIGAGAVVTRDLQDDGVYAGVPARKVRDLMRGDGSVAK